MEVSEAEVLCIDVLEQRQRARRQQETSFCIPTFLCPYLSDN